MGSACFKTFCYLAVFKTWILCSGYAETSTSSCNNTSICHSCYISTLGQSGCVDTLTLDDGSYTLTAEECIQELWSNTTLYGVDYDADTQSCRGYLCDYGLSFSSLGRTVYRKTCNTECLEWTLMRQNYRVMVASEKYDDVTDTRRYLQTCLQWACDASTSICSAAFDSENMLCYKYSTCAPFCETVENKTHDIITKVCHDGIECALPPEGINCTSSSTGSFFSDFTTYTCYLGYALSDGLTKTLLSSCTLYGNWSEPGPFCTLVDCGPPTTPPNGSVELPDGTTFDQMATYSCDKGFFLNGSSFTTCLEDGSWNTSAPDCVFIDCGVPLSPRNGMVEFQDGTGLGALAVYSCNAGNNLIGSSKAYCDTGGYWNETTPMCKVVDCGTLFAPANGMVSYMTGTTDYGSLAFYICLSDYFIFGNEWRTCVEDGKWNGTHPVCTLKDCGYLPNPENGFIEYPGGPVYLEQAIYYCYTGFVAVGSTSRTCLMGGWDGTAPNCEIIACGDPVPPQNGHFLTPNGTLYGMLAIPQCLDGYTLTSNANLTCLESGAWSDIIVVCTEITTNCWFPWRLDQMFGSGYKLFRQNDAKVTQTPVATTFTTVLLAKILMYIMPCTCVTNKTFENLTEKEVIIKLITDTRISLNSTWFTSRTNTHHDERWSATLIGYGSAGFIGLLFVLIAVLDVRTVIQNGGIYKKTIPSKI